MEISKQRVGDALELRVSGRLDAYWADHLSNALAEAVRDGAYNIRLNMADVSYMSSVGIRVLVRIYKHLQQLKGSFVVTAPSPAVKAVLDLAGLGLLMTEAAPAAQAAPTGASRALERAGAVFEIFDVAPGAGIRCRVVGSPEPLPAGCFRQEDCTVLRFPPASFGLGLGAFGRDFADARRRCGEFLCAGGAAACLPTDGAEVPDYLTSAGALVPELTVLYALACEGAFATVARFATQADAGPLPLSELAGACLDMVGADTVGVVSVAESAGLLGAALRRSPAAEQAAGTLFAHPGIREWLFFTPERSFLRSLALVVGVVARSAPPTLAPLLRPLRDPAGPVGHFHAAAFSYRPIQKGAVELQPTVTGLFDGESLLGVLHLLHDDREIVGVGESAFVRGACWVGPITDIVAGQS